MPRIKVCAVCKEDITGSRNKYCSYQCSDKAKKARAKTASSVQMGETKRRTSAKTLRKKAWAMFSKYIRLKYSNSEGMCKCVTCPTIKPWAEMQAGHFIDSRRNSILFDEEIVYPQCYACNCSLDGNKLSYTLFMVKEKGYTIDQIDEMHSRKWRTTKYTAQDYADTYYKYKALFDNLNNRW